MILTTRRRAATALIAAAALTIPSAPVSADGHVSEPLVEGLISPLGLAVDADGTLYIAQAFAGQLSKVDPDGGLVGPPIATPPPGGFIPGVALDQSGSVVYSVSGGTEDGFIGEIRIIDDDTDSKLGDTAALEVRKNSDRRNTYGFRGLHPTCAATVPDEIGGRSYKGEINPNAYAVAAMADGSVVVADAGANALVRVASGRARTLAVLPPVPVEITESMQEALGLDPCVVGSTYYFEPVPTDVELGPDGMLYVSSLAGGPEDPNVASLLGSPGGVFKVNPQTGRVTRVARGFLGAVDLAVSPSGDIYVAELFGGQISKVVNGGPQRVAEVPLPGAVEFARGVLYATIGALPPEVGPPTTGAVVTITP
jgi:streptogramin lyase